MTATKGNVAVCATDTRRIGGMGDVIRIDDTVKLHAVRGGWVSAGGCLPVALLGFEALQRTGVTNLSRARYVVAEAWNKNVEAIRREFPHDNQSIDLTRLHIVRGGSPPTAYVLHSRGEYEPGGGAGMSYVSHPSDLAGTAIEKELTAHFAAAYRAAQTFGDMVRAVADLFRLVVERSECVSPVVDIGGIFPHEGRFVHFRARLSPEWSTASDQEIGEAFRSFSVFNPGAGVLHGETILAGV